VGGAALRRHLHQQRTPTALDRNDSAQLAKPFAARLGTDVM
jgi:hypothetical protein